MTSPTVPAPPALPNPEQRYPYHCGAGDVDAVLTIAEMTQHWAGHQ